MRQCRPERAGGLGQGWGRRGTDRLSPQPHAPFPRILVRGRPRAGGGGLAAAPGSPRGGRVSRGGEGRRPGGRRAAEGSGGSGQAAGLPGGRPGGAGCRPRGCPPQAPLSTSPSTAAPTYADISFIASCVALQRVPFARGSCACPLPLPLSTSLRSLAARLRAHFPSTHYGRGSQPRSEHTTAPARLMTIQRGRRQYGAASQAASRPPPPRPWSRGPAPGHAPSLGRRAPVRLECALARWSCKRICRSVRSSLAVGLPIRPNL